MDLGVCKPFGEIRMEDADLEVQLHIQCGDQHVIRYAYWHWGHAIDGEEVTQALLRYFPKMLSLLMKQMNRCPHAL